MSLDKKIHNRTTETYSKRAIRYEKNGLTGNQRKQIAAFEWDAETLWLAKKGDETCVFITLTLKEHLVVEEFCKRFDVLRNKVLPRCLSKWVAVRGFQKNGRIHVHMLALTPDVKILKSIFRKKLRQCGFGRVRDVKTIASFTDLKSTRNYFVKNLKESYCYPLVSARKFRRITYSPGWRGSRSKFSWVKSGRPYRQAMALLGVVFGCNNFDDLSRTLREQYGPRWYLKFKPWIDALAEKIKQSNQEST